MLKIINAEFSLRSDLYPLNMCHMNQMGVTNLKKKQVAAAQTWKCNICQNILNECFEVDHILCKKDGGTDEITNLQALCPNCHRSKTNADLTKKATSKQVKTALPPWWSEYMARPERQGKLVRSMVWNSYPGLTWKPEITNFSKYTIEELQIMLASIDGEVRQGKNKDIISLLNDKSNQFNQMLNSNVNIEYRRV